MTELEMCKAFAELEGYKWHEFTNLSGTRVWVCVEKTGGDDELPDYNPITDLALNCKARDDYKVNIYHSAHVDNESVNIWVDNGPHRLPTSTSKADIPRAVIECILKSKGLYNEKP